MNVSSNGGIPNRTRPLDSTLARIHEQHISDFGIRCDIRFSFRTPIRRAIQWFTGEICRQIREDNHKGVEREYQYKQNIPNLLFHGTSYESWHSIFTSGLLPKSDGNVCLTDNIYVAELYAYKAAKNAIIHKDPIVLMVDIRNIKRKLSTYFDFRFSPDTQSMIPYVEFKYGEAIPSDRIVGSYVPSFYLTFHMLIDILESVPSRTIEEEKEILYLKQAL